MNVYKDVINSEMYVKIQIADVYKQINYISVWVSLTDNHNLRDTVMVQHMLPVHPIHDQSHKTWTAYGSTCLLWKGFIQKVRPFSTMVATWFTGTVSCLNSTLCQCSIVLPKYTGSYILNYTDLWIGVVLKTLSSKSILEIFINLLT